MTVMNSGRGIEKGYRSLRVLNFKQGHRPVAAAPLIALNVCVFPMSTCSYTLGNKGSSRVPPEEPRFYSTVCLGKTLFLKKGFINGSLED